jgi:hypothetical protein
MLGISDKVAKDFGLGDDQWELMAFTLVNPTNTDISIDLFDPQVANTVNIPTSPSPSLIAPPSIYSYSTTISFNNNTCVVYDTNNSKLWSANYLIPIALIYNEITNSLTATTMVSQNFPSSVSFSATSNKVIYGGLNNILTILDATTEVIITNLALVGFSSVNSIVWNSIKNTWYVARSAKQVDEIDCVTNTLVATILLSGFASPQKIAFDVLTNKIYVTDGSSPLGVDTNEIFEIDCVTNTVLSVISTAGFVSRPTGIAIKYVSGVPTLIVGSSGVVSLNIAKYNLNTSTFTTISSIYYATTIFSHTPSDVIYAFSWLGGFNGQILLIDVNTNSIINNISFLQGTKDASFAYNPSSNTIYVSSFQPIFGMNILSPPPSLYISGDSDINQIVRDGFYSPYWIRRLYFYSSNTENFNQNFFLLTKDANGNLCEVPQVPSLSVATAQFQAGIGMVDYPNKEFILGINQWLKELKVVANSELSLILVYQQLEKSDLLSYIEKEGKGVGSMTYDGVTNTQSPKYNLEQLNFIMPVNALVLPKDETITPVSVQELNTTISKAMKNLSDGTS